jgi:hypothetical protein
MTDLREQEVSTALPAYRLTVQDKVKANFVRIQDGRTKRGR